MILPGTPFGRPCALAKTPARTRKHCRLSLLPHKSELPDNVTLHEPLLPRSIHRANPARFCLLDTSRLIFARVSARDYSHYFIHFLSIKHRSSPCLSRLITTIKLFSSAHDCHAVCQQHIISLNDECHATSTIARTLERPLRACLRLLPYGANEQPSRCSRISMATFENSQIARHPAVTALGFCPAPLPCRRSLLAWPAHPR